MSTPSRSIQQGLLFIAAYVVLDWATFLHPFQGFNITPWNPSLALGLVAWLNAGRVMALPWFAAILIGEALVRGLPAPLTVTLVSSLALTLGYGTMAEVLRRRLGNRRVLDDRRALVTWLAVVVPGTLVTSGLFVGPLVLADLIRAQDWLVALGRFWVGDCVGVLVTLPFLTLLSEPGRRARLGEILWRWETLGHGALALFMLWVLFGIGRGEEFQYFYLLFLPLVWAAARQGLAGAAVSAFQIQAGVLAAVQWTHLVAVTLFDLQLLVAILAFVGLFIGAEVDERQRISRELRQSLHLAAAGEMAAALAHELNQPLTALSAYGTASAELLAAGDRGERLRDVIQRMVAESHRAADVVRRLRDFFRTGATQLEAVPLPALVQSAAAGFLAKAPSLGIELIIEPLPDWTLAADRLQLEVVLRNLLANAFDAVAEQPPGARRVRVSARASGPQGCELAVEDTGPGVSEARASRLFDAFESSKAGGLGLGLTISRAIVVAHGGELWAQPGERGLFKLALPREEANDAA